MPEDLHRGARASIVLWMYLGESFIRDLAVDLPVEVVVSRSSGIMIKPDRTTIEHNGVLKIRLKADVMNASPERINGEIKLNLDNIRYPDIAGESHERRAGKIAPTYNLNVAPESLEEFYVDLPVVQFVEFSQYWKNFKKKT